MKRRQIVKRLGESSLAQSSGLQGKEKWWSCKNDKMTISKFYTYHSDLCAPHRLVLQAQCTASECNCFIIVYLCKNWSSGSEWIPQTTEISVLNFRCSRIFKQLCYQRKPDDLSQQITSCRSTVTEICGRLRLDVKFHGNQVTYNVIHFIWNVGICYITLTYILWFIEPLLYSIKCWVYFVLYMLYKMLPIICYLRLTGDHDLLTISNHKHFI